jgi:hypothetical protein
LTGVVVHPFQIEAEGMATIWKCYFATGGTIESISLYEVAAQ